MHVQKAQEAHEAQESESQEPQPEAHPVAENNNKKKRKADSEGEDAIHKRTRGANGLPEDFFDHGGKPLDLSSSNPLNEIRIPSRPATPLKLSPSDPMVPAIPKIAQTVDESEWAAFEADIAAAEVSEVDAVVISAKPMTTAELAAQSVKDSNRQRKEKAEAEIEGDKEDAARKMEDELEEMEGLEERVRKLRERREALRKKESMISIPKTEDVKMDTEEEDEDDDEEDDDDWDGFRMKG
ncbi:hypothetical protein BJ875DRAFT_380922 [Amylocarpus encephaloides]|uniref:Uncharacterized protein n=1 Tax=Amylocarpus encephaloides TaxID=45428 RepID=A0A9P8C3P8_9HELO|nr:hypothetical protein BJ875DRAFT_380922 [Amylocarpus encephaloides]